MQAVLRERFGVGRLRFYRSNMITWVARDPRRDYAEVEVNKDREAGPWFPRSLHGDTNTDEMFLFTTILYLSQVEPPPHVPHHAYWAHGHRPRPTTRCE